MKKISLNDNGKAALVTAPVALIVTEVFARGGTLGFAVAAVSTFVAARHGGQIKDASVRMFRGLTGSDEEEYEEREGRDMPSGAEIRAHIRAQEMEESELGDEDYELQLEDEDIKTFRQLLNEGVIQAALKRGELCLGYVDGELEFIPIKELFGMGIAGLSKTGKTTTTRFILFQFLLLGSRLVMIDPHISEVEESLAGQFVGFKNIHAMPPCDDDHKEVERRVKVLMKEYLRRKNAGIKGPPLILVIDEFNGLMRRLPTELKKLLSDLLLTIESEARKFGIYCVVIAQRWSENDLGGKPFGAAIRESMSALFVHRLQSEEQAGKLLGGKYKRDCLALQTGHYLFRDSDGGTVEVYTPDTRSEDAVLVQRLLDQRRENRTGNGAFQDVKLSETQTEKLSGETHETRSNGAFQGVSEEMKSSETSDIHTLARTVMGLQADGKNKQEIIRQIWNASPGSTDAYEQAKQEYHQVMKYIAEQLGA